MGKNTSKFKNKLVLRLISQTSTVAFTVPADVYWKNVSDGQRDIGELTGVVIRLRAKNNEHERHGSLVDHFPVARLSQKVSRMLPTLSHLKLIGVELEMPNLRVLARAIATKPGFRELSVCRGKLKSRSCVAIVSDLREAQSLKTLSFSSNLLGDRTAAAIVRLLLDSSVSVLNLSDNKLSRFGISRVDAIISSRTYCKLELRL